MRKTTLTVDFPHERILFIPAQVRAADTPTDLLMAVLEAGP